MEEYWLLLKLDFGSEDPVETKLEKEELLSVDDLVLIPAMNFLSKSRSMAARFSNGVVRLAERRSIIDKEL